MNIIEDDLIFIKDLKLADISTKYLDWLNDKVNGKYTQFGKKKWTFNDLKLFVKNSIKNQNENLYGIFIKPDNLHIGNIRIHDIHKGNAYIGILIGDKNYWGKGLGKKSLNMALEMAFLNLSVDNIFAKIYVDNIPSIKLFEKNNFRKIKSKNPKHLVYKLKREWHKKI